MPVITLHGTPAYNGEVLLLGWSENNRDGMTVRLALDASDEGAVHPFRALGTGKHGQRFMAVLVPIGDDDRPAVPEAPPVADPAKRRFEDMPRAQQAGILCGERDFQQWLGVKDADEAAARVRVDMGIASRSHLDSVGPAWDAMVTDYRVWQRYGDMR